MGHHYTGMVIYNITEVNLQQKCFNEQKCIFKHSEKLKQQKIFKITLFLFLNPKHISINESKGAGKTTYIVSAHFRFLLPTYPDLT